MSYKIKNYVLLCFYFPFVLTNIVLGYGHRECPDNIELSPETIFRLFTIIELKSARRETTRSQIELNANTCCLPLVLLNQY